jgi:hypothetical protein
MSFNEKFDSLIDILENGKKVPFSNMVMVNSDVAQRIALELKEAFPEEFRSAQRLLNEKIHLLKLLERNQILFWNQLEKRENHLSIRNQ